VGEESGKTITLLENLRPPKQSPPDPPIPEQLITPFVILSEAKNLAKQSL
jgi:hypothetical protein